MRKLTFLWLVLLVGCHSPRPALVPPSAPVSGPTAQPPSDGEFLALALRHCLTGRRWMDAEMRLGADLRLQEWAQQTGRRQESVQDDLLRLGARATPIAPAAPAADMDSAFVGELLERDRQFLAASGAMRLESPEVRNLAEMLEGEVRQEVAELQVLQTRLGPVPTQGPPDVPIRPPRVRIRAQHPLKSVGGRLSDRSDPGKSVFPTDQPGGAGSAQ